jgi:nucleotide-binding universal stress UspA family protein
MRVLLATDGSQPAEIARQLVDGIGWPPGSTIRVVTVVSPVQYVMGSEWAAGVIEEADELQVHLQEHGQSLVEQAAGSLARADRAVEQQVLQGRPSGCIVEDARGFGADLIVLGSRGHGAIASMVLGSVAASVTDHAPCPVLVARAPVLTRVLLAHDGSPHATAAEEMLTAWPIFADAAIEVASVAHLTAPWHVTAYSPLYETNVHRYFETSRAVLQHHTDIAEAATDRLRAAGLRASAEVIEGDPGAAIIDLAERHQADLILLGTHGRTGVARLVLGSVARNVMLHAPVSVLVVRPASGPTETEAAKGETRRSRAGRARAGEGGQ